MTPIQEKEPCDFLDVRNATGNFLPGLLAKADQIEVGGRLCIIQSFEPIPLYSAMADLGFEHRTEKVSDLEYRVYFERRIKKRSSFAQTGDMPLKPTAVLNFKKIDDALANAIVNFWNMTWEKENPALDLKTKLLLSLSNGVGAGRFRQATREFIKAYYMGVSVAEMDELFSLFIWNSGVGNFASEIGPSPLFAAYQLVKTLEQQGQPRENILKILLEKFGEENPQVSVLRKE